MKHKYIAVILCLISSNVYAQQNFIPTQSLILKNHQPKPNIFIMFDDSNSVASTNMMVSEHFLGYGLPVCSRPSDWSNTIQKYSKSGKKFYDPFLTGKYVPYNPVTHKNYDFSLYVENCANINKAQALNGMVGRMIAYYKNKAYVGFGGTGLNNTAALTWSFNRDHSYPLIINEVEDLSNASTKKWSEIYSDINNNINILRFRRGWTPTLPALYNLSLYFRNYPVINKSDGNMYGYSYKQYESPLKYRCSSNEILMLTDSKPNRSYIDVFARKDVNNGLLDINKLGKYVDTATTTSPLDGSKKVYTSLLATSLSNVFLNNMFNELAYVEDGYKGSEENIDFTDSGSLDLNRYDNSIYKIPFDNYLSILNQNLLENSDVFSPSHDNARKPWSGQNKKDQKLTINSFILTNNITNKKINEIIQGTGGMSVPVSNQMSNNILNQLLTDFTLDKQLGVMYSNAQSIESQSVRTPDTMRYVFHHDLLSNSGVIQGYSWDTKNNTWKTQPDWTSESKNKPGEVKIVTMDYSSGQAVPKELSIEAISRVFGKAYDTKDLGVAHINWLKGIDVPLDTKASDSRKLKPKPTILGSIVNSKATLYSIDKEYINFDLLSNELRTEFVEAINNNINKSVQNADSLNYKNQLIVNSNDGLINFINAQTIKNKNDADGLRQQAYFPGFLAAKLLDITNVDQPFIFIMDGETDVFRFKGKDGEIKTVGLSGMGAGGKAIVGYQILDNSNVKPLYEIVNEDNFEFNSGGFADLGYSYSGFEFLNQKHFEGRGQGVAVFGNGYGQNKSVLYFVDIETGKLLRSIVLNTTGGGASTPALKISNDKETGYQKLDYVIVGDMSGTLYKVSFDGSIVAGKVSIDKVYYPDVMFRNPITTRPMLYKDSLNSNDVWVYFGTGKKSDERFDRGPNSKNNQYFIGMKLVEGAQPIVLNDLTKKIFTVDDSIIEINESSNPSKGWYLTFSKGERVVYSPVMTTSNTPEIVFSTWGINEGDDNDPCIGDIGYGKQFALNPLSGNKGTFKSEGKNVAGVIVNGTAPGTPSGTGITAKGNVSGGLDIGMKTTMNESELNNVQNTQMISSAPPLTSGIKKCVDSTSTDVVGADPSFCRDLENVVLHRNRISIFKQY